MAEETQTPKEETTDKDIIATLNFLSNPVRFNAEVWRALKIILDKLETMEFRLLKIEERIGKCTSGPEVSPQGKSDGKVAL
jgi:hypothetical protein